MVPSYHETRELDVAVETLLVDVAICFSGYWPGSRSHTNETSEDKETPRQFDSRKSSTADYVPDAQCRDRHQELHKSYQQVGMAQSFCPVDTSNLIEDIENSHYSHPASDRHFEMVVNDGRLVQRRYQLDEADQRINEVEYAIDYVLGSGNYARSDLYRTPGGEFFQTPLGWHVQGNQWRMNPGYDKPDHSGFQRKVTHGCMFCHNA